MPVKWKVAEGFLWGLGFLAVGFLFGYVTKVASVTTGQVTEQTPEILVDVLKADGSIVSTNALVDSGAQISLIPTSLNPKFTQSGFIFLSGFQRNVAPIKVPFGTAWISLDGKEYVSVEAGLTNQVDQMILSPEGVRGYDFSFENGKLQVTKL